MSESKRQRRDEEKERLRDRESGKKAKVGETKRQRLGER